MWKQDKKLISITSKANLYKILLFLLIEISIYIIFLYLDIKGIYSYKISTALKFTGILLCWIFSLCKAIDFNVKDDYQIGFLKNDKVNDSKDNFILNVALFFTVVSDIFLLIFDIYLFGVLTFCIVQFLYLLRITRWDQTQNQTQNKIQDKAQDQIQDKTQDKTQDQTQKQTQNPAKDQTQEQTQNETQDKAQVKFIQNRLICNKLILDKVMKRFIQNVSISILIIIIISVIGFQFEPLIIISVIYFISISRNVVEGFVVTFKSRKKKHMIFAIGMFLFILCDINVGLFNLINISITTQNWLKEIYNFASIAMWMFYLPAQVLITLSGEV